ncbi:hypothetical protein P3S67_028548 [Capsicum chacoense]
MVMNVLEKCLTISPLEMRFHLSHLLGSGHLKIVEAPTEQKHFATFSVDFLHRVRRTAKAGQPGLITSLYKESNRNLVAAIMDETGISCIDGRHAHLMLDPSYEPFRKHGSDLI